MSEPYLDPPLIRIASSGQVAMLLSSLGVRRALSSLWTSVRGNLAVDRRQARLRSITEIASKHILSTRFRIKEQILGPQLCRPVVRLLIDPRWPPWLLHRSVQGLDRETLQLHQGMTRQCRVRRRNYCVRDKRLSALARLRGVNVGAAELVVSLRAERSLQ